MTKKNKKKELINVQALAVKKGKAQHMKAGLIYEVTPALAKNLIKGNKAIKANPSMVVGKVYDLK